MRGKFLFVPAVASLALLAGCSLGGPTLPANVAATANGVESLPAEQILAAGTDAVRNADSFRFSGTVGEGSTAATVNLIYAGDDMQGTGTVLGVVVNLIRKASDLYVKADASLYAQYVPAEHQSGLATLSQTWVRVPASLVDSVLPFPLTVDDLLAGAAPPFTKGEATMLGGEPVITVTDSDGVVYKVATTGEPYLLEISIDGQFLEFSDFNEPVTVEAPAGATDLLDLLLG